MDTIKQIPAKIIEDLELIQPAKLTDDELNTIKYFIDLTREIQETKQLFDVFYFNLLCLRNNFILYAGDTVKKTINCPEFDAENIAVNALVINLISSAKTLAEALRASAIRWLEEDADNKDKFNLYASDVYDKSIIYRVLMNLRDFAQHGSLLVSYNDGRYSFDIHQILTTPHFRFNANVKADMKNFLSNFNPSEEVACLALTITVADFVVKVIDIYRKFLFYIKESVSSAYINIQEMIKTNPTIICNNHQDFNGCVLFWDDDGCHGFDPRCNPDKMIERYEEYVTAVFENEKDAFDKLHPTDKKNCKKELK